MEILYRSIAALKMYFCVCLDLFDALMRSFFRCVLSSVFMLLWFFIHIYITLSLCLCASVFLSVQFSLENG